MLNSYTEGPGRAAIYRALQNVFGYFDFVVNTRVANQHARGEAGGRGDTEDLGEGAKRAIRSLLEPVRTSRPNIEGCLQLRFFEGAARIEDQAVLLENRLGAIAVQNYPAGTVHAPRFHTEGNELENGIAAEEDQRVGGGA